MNKEVRTAVLLDGEEETVVKNIGTLRLFVAERTDGDFFVWMPKGLFKEGDLVLHVPGGLKLTGEIQKEIRRDIPVMFYTTDGVSLKEEINLEGETNFDGGILLDPKKFFGEKGEFKDPVSKQFLNVKTASNFDFSSILGIKPLEKEEEIIVPVVSPIEITKKSFTTLDNVT